jgi:hypothetical protein
VIDWGALKLWVVGGALEMATSFSGGRLSGYERLRTVSMTEDGKFGSGFVDIYVWQSETVRSIS